MGGPLLGALDSHRTMGRTANFRYGSYGTTSRGGGGCQINPSFLSLNENEPTPLAHVLLSLLMFTTDKHLLSLFGIQEMSGTPSTLNMESENQLKVPTLQVLHSPVIPLPCVGHQGTTLEKPKGRWRRGTFYSGNLDPLGRVGRHSKKS